jgi:hemimethylated DNA binding protein
MATLSLGEASSSKITLAAFPNEVFEAIFDHLSPLELSRLAQTSRSICQVATSSTLWERAYYSFWREGDTEREARRGTTVWRTKKRYADLKDAARQAWLLDGEVMNSGEHHSKRRRRSEIATGKAEQIPFPLYLSSPMSKEGFSAVMPQFYRLFLERMQIDEEVLQVIKTQCCSGNGWMERVRAVVDKHGNDAKDVLHALVTCQLRRGDEDLPDYEEEIERNKAGVFPNALQVRLPSTNRSPTHHLVLLHYGRELLEHLQCREALQGFLSYRPGCTIESLSPHWISAQCQDDEEETRQGLNAAKIGKSFEVAISWLSMFRGGEGQEIAEEIDVLSVSCSLYLASQEVPLHFNTQILAGGIYDFMQSRGFKGATPAEYENLDNNFLHRCLDESGRETLPLSLTVIYCAIACRLGLSAYPTNTPARVLIVVEPRASPSSSTASGTDRFWIDIYGDGKILDANDVRMMLARMRLQMQGDFIGPSTAAATCLRASRNVVRSVQGAQGAPRLNAATQGDDADSDMDMDKASLSADGSQQAADVFEKIMMSSDSVYNPRRTYLTSKGLYLVSPFWSILGKAKKPGRRYQRDSSWSDYDQQAAMHAASNALTRLGDELGDRGSDWCSSLVQTYFPLDSLIMQNEFTNSAFNSPLYVQDERSRTSMSTMFQGLLSEDQVGPTATYRSWPEHSSIHKVGTLFTHRAYGYKAAIIGWNDHCSAPESWILNMGVDNLPNGGREQPFYQSVHEDGSTRYVAHCNIVPATLDILSGRSRNSVEGAVSLKDAEDVLRQRGIGKLFRCLSQQGSYLRLVKSETGHQAFPDD